MKQQCGNCAAGLFMDGGNGVCRAHPPQVTIVLMPFGTVKMELRPMPIAAHPNVAPDGWCAEYTQGSVIQLGGH